MPPLPEFTEARRQIGIIEIEHEFETHQPCGSARHVGIPAEIEINLPGERIRCQQRYEPLKVRRASEDFVDIDGKEIRKGNFLEQSHDKQR